jgi:thymidylate synthase
MSFTKESIGYNNFVKELTGENVTEKSDAYSNFVKELVGNDVTCEKEINMKLYPMKLSLEKYPEVEETINSIQNNVKELLKEKKRYVLYPESNDECVNISTCMTLTGGDTLYDKDSSKNLTEKNLEDMLINIEELTGGDVVYEELKCVDDIQTNEDEEQYLKLMMKILDKGDKRMDRTKVGTLSLFGERLEFDLSNNTLPIINTKKVNYSSVIKELLFFISGKTDTKILEKQGVNIWKGNTSKEFLEKRGLKFQEGDMGPGYGFQWRHSGAGYIDCTYDNLEEGIDQLQDCIDTIRNNPFDRRIIVCSWIPQDIYYMALPPCHCLFQFYVTTDGYLDCQLYQRSGDYFLGIPYNITSYCLLTHMIAHITGLKARKFVHIIGDAHIYLNHIEQCYQQLSNEPNIKYPTVSFGENIKEIGDFSIDNISIEEYISYGLIKAEMAI